MGRLVMSEFLTPDGVMGEPSWTVPCWNDELAAFKGTEMAGAGALPLGRVTHGGFARAWPSRTDEESGARMNALPKYVASATLTRADGQNATGLGADVAGEVAALKARLGGDLLLARGLVAGLNLIVSPPTPGAGKRLFTETPVRLTPLDSRAFSSGAVLLQYAPARK